MSESLHRGRGYFPRRECARIPAGLRGLKISPCTQASWRSILRRMAVGALIAAIVSALAAAGAVIYACRMDRTAKAALKATQDAVEAANTSATASVRSASAAELGVSLEVERRHTELRPRFRVDLIPESRVVRFPVVAVVLLGPPELGRLDELKVTIRDTRRPAAGWKEPGMPEVTPEQMDEVIWGPYRFFEGDDATGRVASKEGMAVGDERRFSLVPTSAPSWAPAEPEAWQIRVGAVLGLRLEARREGWEPWTLPGQVDSAAESTTVEIP
jgi:hypothetical protein